MFRSASCLLSPILTRIILTPSMFLTILRHVTLVSARQLVPGFRAPSIRSDYDKVKRSQMPYKRSTGMASSPTQARILRVTGVLAHKPSAESQPYRRGAELGRVQGRGRVLATGIRIG
jgi:hypothetical protein